MSLQNLEGDDYLCVSETVVGKEQVRGKEDGMEGKGSRVHSYLYLCVEDQKMHN